jgi:AraC family transcriptional regulator of adaptative response/methylated-DNA-[protein]-cysteine methyltransferase
MVKSQQNIMLSNIWTDHLVVVSENKIMLLANRFDTPLGEMLAVADEDTLTALQFIERDSLDCEIASLQKKFNTDIRWSTNDIHQSIRTEMLDYFAGKKVDFETPLQLVGTLFQKRVWQALSMIPFGETRSYLEIAKLIKMPTAFRAVALANAANPIVIVVPCHRVINANGKLGGYSSGIARKEWLLKHENKL